MRVHPNHIKKSRQAPRYRTPVLLLALVLVLSMGIVNMATLLQRVAEPEIKPQQTRAQLKREPLDRAELDTVGDQPELKNE